jgi:hypothetical protein
MRSRNYYGFPMCIFSHSINDRGDISKGFFLSERKFLDYIPSIFINAYTGSIKTCTRWDRDVYGSPDLFGKIGSLNIGFGVWRNPPTGERYFGIENWVRIDEHPLLEKIVCKRLSNASTQTEVKTIEELIAEYKWNVNIKTARYKRFVKANNERRKIMASAKPPEVNSRQGKLF